MNDDELIALYHERGVPSEWQELTPDQMRPAFRLYFRALPSPSMEVDGSAEAELLIHDPLTALREARIISADGQENRILADDGHEPHISTFVVNHEKTLNRFVMYASVAVSTNPHTVGITIVKEEAPKSPVEPDEEPEESQASE